MLLNNTNKHEESRYSHYRYFFNRATKSAWTSRLRCMPVHVVWPTAFVSDTSLPLPKLRHVRMFTILRVNVSRNDLSAGTADVFS